MENQVNKLTCKLNNLSDKYSFLDKMFLIELLSKPKLIIFSQIFLTYSLENSVENSNSLLNNILEEYISFLVENELKINDKKSIYILNAVKVETKTIHITISFFSNNPAMHTDLLDVINNFENILSNDFRGNIFMKMNDFLTLWGFPLNFFGINKVLDNIINGRYNITEIKTDIKDIQELLCNRPVSKKQSIDNEKHKEYTNLSKMSNNEPFEPPEPFEPSEIDSLNYDIPTLNSHLKIQTTDADTDTYTKSSSVNSINEKIKKLLEITTTNTNEFD